MTSIIEYQAQYHAEFRELNLEWLDKYHLTESHDLEVLDDPEGAILQRGGHIYLALQDGKVVGTSALAREDDETFELAKMSVAPSLRGQGIGQLLIGHCIARARDLGAKKLLLWSNSQLQPAIALYSKFGFRHTPVVDSPFVTADVRMELTL